MSDSFDRTDEKCVYEVAFRRWLVREIEEGKLTVTAAIRQFNFHPHNGKACIRDWRRKYAPEMVLTFDDRKGETGFNSPSKAGEGNGKATGRCQDAQYCP